MAQLYGVQSLAPAGSTGNVTGTALTVPADVTSAAFQFVVEAVGGTPTVTFKFQGSMDGTNWYDLPYILPSTDTLSQAGTTVTALGASLQWLAEDGGYRYFYQYRVVTSANTNVTFRAECYLLAGVN